MEYNIGIGTVINELTILSYCTKPKDDEKYKSYGGPWVRCKCSCGNEVVVPLYGVKRGFIKSCGHLKGQKGGEILKQYYKENDPPNATYLTIDGETRNISEWSKITGIPRTTLLYRISKNMPIEKIFERENNNATTDGN